MIRPPVSTMLFAVLCVLVALSLARQAFAQFGPPARTRPAQVPLSDKPPGSVTTGQATAPNVSSAGVDTLNSTIGVEGAFQGSTPTGVVTKEPLSLSLDGAIKRGIAYNLGMIGALETDRRARALRLAALAQLLPNIDGVGTVAVEQMSLATLGLQSARGLAGFQFARVLGPFNFFEAGAAMSQTLFDLTAIRNYRSRKELADATTFNVRNDRDLVILAVGGSYLQVVAAGARVEAAQAQLKTATRLYEQAVDQNKAGVNARIDVSRSLVELQTQRLRLISLETDLASQKLALGRLIGLPLGQVFNLTTNMDYRPIVPITVEAALGAAFESRADLQAADAQVRAAVQAQKAAEAEKLPAVTFTGNYVVAGVNPAQSNGVFGFSAAIDVPIWTSGRIRADIAEANAVLTQRRAEYNDTRGRIDFEVRNALLQLNAATQQVSVAESNRGLARETLQQAGDRFAAGVTDTVEVVQAQESVAASEQDYISAVYAHYLARLSLARATGNAEQGIQSLLRQTTP